MYTEWLGQVNWVDFLFFIILLRIMYVGFKKKLVVEFFSFLGILFGVFFSLHYYSRLAAVVANNSALPLDISMIVAYVVLLVITMLAFKFILDGVLLLFRIEPRGFLDRWGGLLFSILKGALVCGLVGVFFIISTVNYLEFSVRQSFLGNRLTSLAPLTYKLSYIHAVSKFFPDEPLNYDVFDVIEEKAFSGEEI